MMHLRRHSKLAKYAKALVGEGVDQPSDQDDEVDQDDKVMLHLMQAYVVCFRWLQTCARPGGKTRNRNPGDVRS